MNRPVPKALSRAAFIVAALLVAYLIFSALSLVIGRGNWILILVTVAIIVAFAIPFIDKAFGDKAFGDKLPFLSNWPPARQTPESAAYWDLGFSAATIPSKTPKPESKSQSTCCGHSRYSSFFWR